MILITCPACQAQVSEHASHCPKCGHPLRKDNSAVPPAGTQARHSRRLLIGCLAIPLIGFLLFVLVGIPIIISNYVAEQQRLRSQTFTTLLDTEIAEADIGTTLTKKIAEFQPQAAWKPVRITLALNQPYEFEASEPGHFEFYPTCELLVFRRSSGFLRQTSFVGLKTVPRAPPVGNRTPDEYKRLRISGVRQMKIEFIPDDTDMYWIEFKGPPKGFKKYRLLVEQLGL